MEKKIDTSPFPIEIGRVPKTKKDTIVVSINDYGGNVYIDVRQHFSVGSELLPTKKGITLNMLTFEPVARLLLRAYEKLKEIRAPEQTEKTDGE
jgi:hypothetical protein